MQMQQSLIRDGFRIVLLFFCFLICQGSQVATGSPFSDGYVDESPSHSLVPVQSDLQVLEREWHQIPDGPTVEMSIEHLRKMAEDRKSVV